MFGKVKTVLALFALQVQLGLFDTHKGRSHAQMYFFTFGRFKTDNRAGMFSVKFQRVGHGAVAVSMIDANRFIYIDDEEIFKIL